MVTIRDTLAVDIVKKVTRKEIRDKFLLIDRVAVENVVHFLIALPFIGFPNYAHKGTDWKVLGECAEKLSLLFKLLSMYLYKDNYDESFCLSNEPQLMLIETGYSRERDMHACPMEIAFSENIAKLLAKKYCTGGIVDIPFTDIAREAYIVYLKLSSKTKKGFEKDLSKSNHFGGMFDVSVKIRSCGVPSFSVPGNCACLGENPDTFTYSRDMHSHNLDSTLQQMTMIVVVVAFWNKVLKPLYQESLSV
jgi:hypothetical protein